MPNLPAPAPRTWSPGDIISAPRLRADMAGAAAWLTGRPQLVAAQLTTNQVLTASAVTPLTLDTEYYDNWYGHNSGAAVYTAQTPGWYLAEGDAEASGLSSSSTITAGIQAVLSGTATSNDGGKISSNGNNNAGAACADLRLCNTGDTVALYATINGTSPTSMATARFRAELAALPSGPVVTNPQPAATWPPGSGTVIASPAGLAAGATSLVASNPAGMVPGGTLGLGYPDGLPPLPGAETVTIVSVTGTTVRTTPCLNPHAAGDPVAVPVSAAFLNQQSENAISFLTFPPLAVLTTAGTSQNLSSSTFPSSSVITWTQANADTYSGWNNATQYVFPVEGVWYIYGQVYTGQVFSASVCAGYRISGGTTRYGTTVWNQSSTPRTLCATVRAAAVRVTAGQYVEIMGMQDSGSSVALQGAASGGAYCKLIALWRGF